MLEIVTTSAAEAELGALFLNVQQAKIIQLTLIEMRHQQPQIPIHVDNTTMIGIVNNTIKCQNHELWKCNISGYYNKKPKKNSNCIIIQDSKIWAITTQKCMKRK